MQDALRLNPYPGPWPYQHEHKALFAGRDSETEELVSRIMGTQFVFLYSQSGAGKSSLINTLLQEKLEEKGYRVLRVKNLAGATERRRLNGANSNPFISNMFLSLSHEASQPRAIIKELEGLLMEQQLALIKHEIETNFADKTVKFKHETFARRMEEHYPETNKSPFVFIFDQFEEIFTTPQQYSKHRRDFFDQINQLAEALPHSHFLFSFREEYLAFFDRYLGQLDLDSYRFHLDLLTMEQALQVIRKPITLAEKNGEYARVYDKKYAEGVPEAIVAELVKIPIHWESDTAAYVEGEYVEPVQLQLVCRKLWDKLGPDEKLITMAHLEQIGGVEKVLVDYYEESIHALKHEKVFPGESPMRQWIEQKLITELNTRNYLLRKSAEAAGMPIEIVTMLEDRHLLRTEERSDAHWVSLSHDRLIPAIRQSNARYRLKRFERYKFAFWVALAFLIPLVALFVDRVILSQRQSPEQALGYLLSGKTHFEARSYEQAARDLRESLEQAPTAEASLLLGQTLEKLGQTGQALQQYEATLQLDPQKVEAYRFLGLGRLGVGDSVAAYEALTKYFELSGRPPREVLVLSAYADLAGYYFSKQIESPRRREAFDLALRLRHQHVPYRPYGKSPETGFDALGFISYVLQNSGISSPFPRTVSDLNAIFAPAATPAPMDLIIIRGREALPLFYIGEFFGESLCIGVGPTAFVEIVDRKQLLGGLVTYYQIPY